MGLLEQFKQQMMKAWQPVPTLTKTIIMFFILSAIFLSIGIVMIILSKNLSESLFRYDMICSDIQFCTVNFEVTDLLQAPVFVYYEIHNFYQNHRLYASSFSYDQLTGETISESTVKIPIISRPNLHAHPSFTTATYTKTYPHLTAQCFSIPTASPIHAAWSHTQFSTTPTFLQHKVVRSFQFQTKE